MKIYEQKLRGSNMLCCFNMILDMTSICRRELERIDARAAAREQEREDEFQKNGPQVKLARSCI